MKNRKKPFNARLGIVIGLALLLLLSITLQTTGGAAKYRTQVSVSGTIQYTQLTSTTEDPAEPESPETEEPGTDDSKAEEPGTGEDEVVEPEEPDDEASEPDQPGEASEPDETDAQP